MGASFYFLEEPATTSAVLNWFRDQPTPPTEAPHDRGVVLHFHGFGPLVKRTPDFLHPSEIDEKHSPVMNLFLPAVKRGVFWTMGEVHFLTTSLRQTFPALYHVQETFRTWLRQHDCVFSAKSFSAGSFDYYLEGSTRNTADAVYALPTGMTALRAGRYFIAARETDAKIDTLCRMLRLRGVEADPL
jgi:hypothetical protein